eukprot:scaffold15769_cov125-Isochrysis_galbana.AAC.3
MHKDPISQYEVASAHGCGHVFKQCLLQRLNTTFSAHQSNTLTPILSCTRGPVASDGEDVPTAGSPFACGQARGDPSRASPFCAERRSAGATSRDSVCG